MSLGPAATAEAASVEFAGVPAEDLPTAPHPFPYQGSKRNIARRILPFFPADAERLVEPFCGSAAVSLAAAAAHLADPFWLNDRDAPLMELWDAILECPEGLAEAYGAFWRAQRADRKAFFGRVRAEFNRTRRPDQLLFLLARIVKGSVRYGRNGHFNQSPDNRRWGMRPETMRRNLVAVSALLSGRTKTTSGDFRRVADEVGERDLIYLDPPYQGTSSARDRRYCDGVEFELFAGVLEAMNRRRLSFIVSYDGRTGDKAHGEFLPSRLRLRRIPIHAGRSSQATLLGRRLETVESLYLSPALVERLGARAARNPAGAPLRRNLLFA